MADNMIEVFYTAVLNNDIPKVLHLVKVQGVDVDFPDEQNYQETALHKAAEKGYLEMVYLLVDELGAEVQVDDMGGVFPMHRAFTAGYMEIARYLMNKGTPFSEHVEECLNNLK